MIAFSKRIAIVSAAVVVGLAAFWLQRFAVRWSTPPDVVHAVSTGPSGPESNPLELEPVDASRSREHGVAGAEPSSSRRSSPAGTADDAATGTLLVRTIDATGKAPLSNIRVVADFAHPVANPLELGDDPPESRLGMLTVTAEDGRVEIVLPVGVDLALSAWGTNGSAGRVTALVPGLIPGERRELDIELPTADDLRYFGRVLTEEDRTPAAGAKVRLVARDRSVSTAPDGTFELSLPSWLESELRVEAPGFSSVIIPIDLAHGTNAEARIILLSRTATLRVHFRDATGAPVSAGVVRVWIDSYDLGESDFWTASAPFKVDRSWNKHTEDPGDCTFEGLPTAVPLNIECYSEERGPRRLQPLILDPGEVREVEWKIGVGCCIRGSVVDQNGELVTDKEIWLERCTGDRAKGFEIERSEVDFDRWTDAKGEFEFRDVNPGKWWIGPGADRKLGDLHDAKAIAPFAEVVEVPAGASEMRFDLRVHRGTYIRGKVFDQVGKPAAALYVWGSCLGSSFVGHAETREDGLFAMGPLVPGRYRLVAAGTGPDASSDPVEADAGEDGVVLRLRAGGKIKGVVLDGASRTGCQAEVMLSPCDTTPTSSLLQMASEEDGTFESDGLEPGSYDVMAKASGGRFGVLRGVMVRAGVATQDLVLTLAPGAILRVRYAGQAERMWYQIRNDGALLALDEIRPGSSSERTVLPGRLLVEWNDGGTEVQSKVVEIEPGEEKEVVLSDPR
jgi:hypothetical protein